MAKSMAKKSSRRYVRSLFLRGLGLVYFAAFRSLRAQVLGLYGKEGITPVAPTLEALRSAVPEDERLRRLYSKMPTLLWRDASDESLACLCRNGEKLGLMLFFGVAPPITAAAAWVHWLSLVTVGGEFLGYQWDALLLEAGLAAALVAPLDDRREPPALEVAYLRFLAFRLHLMSGLVKHASPDHAWRDRSAMIHYYETAPLPTVPGWFAHHLPARFQRFSTTATLAIEIGAPLLFFGPRPLRVVGFAATTALQTLIALTGNYNFFNALAVVVTVPVLDDRALGVRTRPKRRASLLRRVLDVFALAPLALVAVEQLLSLVSNAGLPRKVRRVVDRAEAELARLARMDRVATAIAPLRSVNPYGPFSLMTRDRPEIAIEGSDDAVTWREYELPYKVTDPKRAPRWAAPHQPRVDWQMWFAALRGRPPSWFTRMMIKLLQGSKEVEALFARVPFDHPPKYVRATLHRYRMASLAEWKRSGAWWTRERLGGYFPPVTLSNA